MGLRDGGGYVSAALAELYDDFDRSPFGDESPHMIFVAEKAGHDAGGA